MSRAVRKHLGIQPGDLENKPYAKYWNPLMAPLPEHAREALAQGPIAPPMLPAFADAAMVFETSSAALENGFALSPEGALHVAIRTEMPECLPGMVDWWFGWHSEEPQRYKLWHPRAHVHAEWRPNSVAAATRGASEVLNPSGNETVQASAIRDRYVGRTSCVDEYVGSTLGSYFIRFLNPAELGLDLARLADPRIGTAICARIGFANLPFDFGYLAHYVTRTPGGSVMQSRFWIGGDYARPRRGGLAADLALRVTKRIMRPSARDGAELLVHCSQEMSHLASFLPKLHAELGDT
ncbi:MAG: hypothetical protein U1D30_11785 [Planctomycetota bacterium]